MASRASACSGIRFAVERPQRTALDETGGEVHDERAFDSERKISGVAEQRHLEDVEALHVGDAVVPFGQASVVPHLPEESAYQRSERGLQDRTPVAPRERREDRFAHDELL